MGTLTTTFSFNLPTVSGDKDTWGTLLNANFTALDDLLDGTTSATFTLNGQLNVDNIRLDGNSIISTDTNGAMTIAPNGTGNILLETDTAVFGETSGNADIVNRNDVSEMHISGGNSTSSGANIRLFGGTHATKASDLVFRRDTTNVFEIDGATGDLLGYEDDGTTVSWSFDASTGIFDFTSLSIAGELFGNTNWTPVYTPDSGSFSSETYLNQTARSIPLGDQLCYIELRIRHNAVNVGSAAGNIAITGVPKSASGTSKPLTVGFRGAWNTKPVRAMISGNSILLYDDNDTRIAVGDLDFTGNNKNELFISGIYQTI